MNENEKNKLEQDDIEKLIKKATDGNSGDNDPGTPSPSKSKSAKKVIISASVAFALFVSALGYGAYVLKSQDKFVDKTEKPAWVTKEEEEKAKEYYESDFEFERPLKVKSWAKIPFDESKFWEDKAQVNKAISETKKISSVVNVLNWVPTGEKNKSKSSNPDSILVTESFTNDVSKMRLENGEENEMFSYALREDYMKTLAVSSERLLNPVFGNWSFSDSGRNPEIYSVLYDLFDEEWWIQNVDSSSVGYKKLPILENWDGKEFNNLGLKERDNGEGVFFGQIKETKNKKVIAKTQSHTVNNSPVITFELPIEYSAFLENGGVHKKYGTLSLTLSPNEDSSDVNKRVIVSSAKLEMEK